MIRRDLPVAERAVAIGTFDGVHLGHRAVIEAAKATGLRSTVVTFHPHPREVLGYEVALLSTFERRLELIEALEPDDILVVEFTLELSRLEPEEFVETMLAPIGTRVVLAGENFRFGQGSARRHRSSPEARASTCARCRSSRASRRAASGRRFAAAT